MSGIIFNGVEMKKGESKNEYIKRVFEKMELSEHDEPTPENSTDDETVSESDTDSDSDSELSHTFKLLFKCMLGTYDCNMEEHDDAIRWFNNKYGTKERGSNGSKGHYFTHGDTIYDLFQLKKLKSLYDRGIFSVSIYNVKIHLHFIKCDDDENQEYNEEEKKEEEEFKNTLNNFKSQRDEDRFIEIRKCKDFMRLMNRPEIELKRDYEHSKSTHKHTFKIGDVVFYNDCEYFKNVHFWQIVKITKQQIKIKPLKPILTIKHMSSENNKANVYKYKKDDFINNIKSVYVNKKSHNTVYIFDDYIYRLYKDE